MKTISLTAQPEEAGQRADRFIAARLDDVSRSRIKVLIKEGALTCDGMALTDPNASVLEGAEYRLDVPDPRPATPEPQDIPLDILFEDDDLILINKPAGMAVHPAPGSWDGTLVNALLHHCKGELPGIGGVERPGIVHRLDKDTTGVMVVAKTEAAHRGLSDLFATHDIDRAYLALTRGAPRPLSGKVDAPIARASGDRKKMAVPRNPDAPNARHAVTHYKALETYGLLDKGAGLPAAALIECRLETGRTHQIRVHMSHIGAPLIGDNTYGRHRGIKSYGSGEAFIQATSLARGFPRQALHAALLGFVHPVTGEALSFEAPLPEDMVALKAALSAMPR
ncbi:MAG: RluA family pseudouridine synthase [Hyphomonadaceae bacterium]|nr:RluA family pseudouridine synthase [Hyphomonadaceae bacterium]